MHDHLARRACILAALVLGCSQSPDDTNLDETIDHTFEAATTTPAFPLKLSANKRYLVDQNNSPFLINQASSWGLIQALSTADATAYLDALKQRGFNTVMISVISNDTRMAGSPPNWQGISPFNVKWDFSTPNESYFAHADQIINLARDRGMLVTLVPSYLGYPGDANQGWFDEMLSSTNSVAKSQAYGRFLGLRYKNFNNIVWIAGGDNTPAAGSELEARLKAIVDGIRENDGHLWTGHWDSVHHAGGVLATENPTFTSYMSINGYYAYNYDLTYQRDLAAYNRTPPMMLYHLDQSYETEPGGTPVNIRRKAYSAMLSGAAGSSFCAGPNWYLFFNWKTNMDTTATKETQYWNALFKSREWYDLVPDQSHVAVTAGLGTSGSTDFVTAARTSTGSTVMAFLPTSRQVTVDMTRVSGTQAKAWWYNPTNGQATLIGTFPTTGSHAFTPATGDWLLVLDDASRNFPPPGGTVTASNPPTVATAASAAPASGAVTTATLNVLGADDGGEPNLSYTWAATAVPSGGAATFSANGNNAAKRSVVTFTKAGSYTLRATITDAEGQAVTSSTSVNVTQGQTQVSVAPSSAAVPVHGTQQFTATAKDQFGAPMATQPTFTWMSGGGGSISSSGLFTAGSTPGGPFTVTALAGSQSGTASVTVTGAVPAYVYRINSGGAALAPFAADQFFAGGASFSTTATISTAAANAAPAAIYQNERYGDFTYTLAGLTAGAAYTVRLHLAEIYWNAANSRLFNLKINGTQVLTNFDVFAAAGGKNIAYVRDLPATANASGQIVLGFVSVKDKAKVNGIEVFH
jgi:hypothetical protein